MKKYLFTTQEDIEDRGLKELKNLDESVKFSEWVDAGIGVVEADETLVEKIKEKPPIFVRHIHPVDDILSVSNNDSDIDIFKDYVEKNLSKINSKSTFSVQTRLLKGDEWSYTKFIVNNGVSTLLEDKGFMQDTKAPKQVISITVKRNKAYVGISNAKDNISDWTGGEHRFKMEDDQISRAEFKLLEAIDCFNINMSRFENSLDIGAAPGGWTKVLLDNGIKVDAVDPAEMDEELVKDNNMKHHKMSVQQFVRKDLNSKYDLIVNDMKMDGVKSSEHMKSVEKYLAPNGMAIMTLKLPKENFGKILNDAIKSLKEVYRIIRIKQLFNNRSEVTFLLGKIGGQEVKLAVSKEQLADKEVEKGNRKARSNMAYHIEDNKKANMKKDANRLTNSRGKKLATRPDEKKSYRKEEFGEKKEYRKPYRKERDDRESYGENKEFKKPYDSKKEFKKQFGEKKDYKKPYGEKRDYKKPYGEMKDYKKPYGEKKDKKSYGEKREYKKPYGEKKDYKKPYGEKRDYKKSTGEKKEFKKSYEDKKEYKKPFGEKKDYKKSFGSRGKEIKRNESNYTKSTRGKR